MRTPATAVAMLAVFLAGCAGARPPGTFADAGPLHSNTLHLNGDGTFSYEAWSDGGGLSWRAEGTWKWIDADRFETEVTKITAGPENDFTPLRRNQVWRVTGRGVSRDTAFFERQ
jgi:hypothetical protein